jgi:hypothetical protein
MEGFRDKVTELSSSTLDVKRLAPKAAREIGTFKLRTKGPDPKEISGKYVLIWKRERSLEDLN